MNAFNPDIFRERVWSLMHIRRLPLSQVAKENYIAPSTFGRIMRNGSSCHPPVALVFNLSEYFGVSTDYLLGIKASKGILDGKIAELLELKENQHIKECLAEMAYTKGVRR